MTHIFRPYGKGDGIPVYLTGKVLEVGESEESKFSKCIEVKGEGEKQFYAYSDELEEL